MVNKKIISPRFPLPPLLSLLNSHQSYQIALTLIPKSNPISHLSRLYQTRVRHIFSHAPQPIASSLSASILLPSSSSGFSQGFRFFRGTVYSTSEVIESFFLLRFNWLWERSYFVAISMSIAFLGVSRWVLDILFYFRLVTELTCTM